MKVLIITQAVDRKNPILGFFHRWIEEFSKKFESVVVICLEKGKYTLPSNVNIFSLGKEIPNSQFTIFKKIQYIWRFYKYIWKERKNYDVVFVHMNQEYIILAGFLWILLRKKVYMWRNHGKGSILTDIAASFCTKVFCTSRFSYTAKYKKTVIMPVGVNVEGYRSGISGNRKTNSVLFLGRIAPVKNPHLLIEAVTQIDEVSWNMTIVGDPLPQDKKYYQSLKERCQELKVDSKVSFLPAVLNSETPAIYSTHDIFVNLSPNGMYDKTIFEAISGGAIVLTSNKNFIGEVSDKFIFEEGNAESLKNKMEEIMKLSEQEKEQTRKEQMKFAKKHDIRCLSDKILEQLSND